MSLIILLTRIRLISDLDLNSILKCEDNKMAAWNLKLLVTDATLEQVEALMDAIAEHSSVSVDMFLEKLEEN